MGLSDLPIVLWDESRLANNAIEMSQDGFGLVTTYLGQPDLWNTKPPLLIWLMAACLDLFGPSEWALRLPSAVAALGTCGIVYWFCRSVTGSRVAGIAGALVLLTTYGFVAPHVARTGDYDALLVFFAAALVTTSYHILEDLRRERSPSNGLIVCASLALLGAIMTKGVAGLMILPGIALASLTGGAIFNSLRDRRLWVALLLPFALTAGYYVVREFAAPGYSEAVWANEIGGRFSTPLEGHSRPALFYLLNLLSPFSGQDVDLYLASAFPWSWLVLILVPLGTVNARFAPVLAYFGLVAISFLIVISVAQTKISWYVAPVYPLVACLAGISAFAVWQRASFPAGAAAQRRSALLLLGLFAFIVSMVGSRIVERHRLDLARASDHSELRSAAFLRALTASLQPDDALRIVRDHNRTPSAASLAHFEYSPQEKFYATLMRGKGIDAQIVTPDYRPRPGDMLTWCDRARPNMQGIAARIRTSHGSCHLVQVDNPGNADAR
jgi:4-amino-4-deoxy-L-arabinose transferase-like glycosyltransferase